MTGLFTAAGFFGTLLLAVAFPDPGKPSTSPVALEAWKSSDLPRTVAQRLRASTDKRAFYDRAVGVGGGGHLMMARQVMLQCLPVSRMGMAGAEQEAAGQIPARDPDFHRRMEAKRALLKGCDGFEMRPVTIQELEIVEGRLKQATDPMARAFVLSRVTEQGEDARKLARELIETQDPYVIRSVSYHLYNARLASARLADLTRQQTEEIFREQYAWLWAVCELGLDCESSMNQPACVMGHCDINAPDDRVRVRKDQLVAAIRTRDWKALGL